MWRHYCQSTRGRPTPLLIFSYKGISALFLLYDPYIKSLIILPYGEWRSFMYLLSLWTLNRFPTCFAQLEFHNVYKLTRIIWTLHLFWRSTYIYLLGFLLVELVYNYPLSVTQSVSQPPNLVTKTTKTLPKCLDWINWNFQAIFIKVSSCASD